MPKPIQRELNRASLGGVLAEGHPVVTKTADYTVLREESGTIFMMGTDGKTFTLPATVKGLVFTFVNSGADDAVKLNISPQAADAIHGGGLTSVDDEDLSNTKSGANEGDYVRLEGDGAAGYWISGIQGTWAKG